MNRTAAFPTGLLCIVGIIASINASPCYADDVFTIDDFVAWKLHLWETAGAAETIPGDFNMDGSVDLGDLVIVKRGIGFSRAHSGTFCDEDIILHVNASGLASLVNTTDNPVQFDGYLIRDSAAMLDSTAWYSLIDRVYDQSQWPIDWFQTGVPDFGEIADYPAFISEACLKDMQTLMPGEAIDLGLIAPNGWETLSFMYINSAASGSGMFDSIVVPEPASMSLLALGGLAMIRRRR